MAGIEGRGQLLERVLLPRAFQSLEEDDRPAPISDLRKLQFGNVLAQGSERRLDVVRRSRRWSVTFRVAHGSESSGIDGAHNG
jgi:hypothetical protein